MYIHVRTHTRTLAHTRTHIHTCAILYAVIRIYKYYVIGYPTTSISGNNIRKYLLESDFLASKLAIVVGYPYFPATYRKYSNFIGGIPLKLAIKSLSSKTFLTLFPQILVMGYPLKSSYLILFIPVPSFTPAHYQAACYRA